MAASMGEIKNAYDAGRRAATKHATIIEAVYAGALDDSYDATEGIAWDMGFAGAPLREVTGWRYGDIPLDGRSHNYRDNMQERGVSLMAIDGEEPTTCLEGITLAGKRPVVRVRGYLIGHGASGEPLVIGAERIEWA